MGADMSLKQYIRIIVPRPVGVGQAIAESISSRARD